ncbi:MAG: ferritin-like protein [Micrococcales bacterium]|nr:ferritin-like protein [Micrococcales bacterium]
MPHPRIVVEHRKELSYLLCQAAEIEHLAMGQYLYTAFSLRSEVGPGVTAEQFEAVERWRRVLLSIAAEEMLHWAMVNNLLTAIGSAPYVSRPNYPQRAKGYPPSVQFELLPFSEDALRHFVYFERAMGVDVEDAGAFAHVGEEPPPMAPTELQPRPQAFLTQGQLYGSLGDALRDLTERLGEDGLFIGPPWAQAAPESFGWKDLVPVHALQSALAVLAIIVEQGEGATEDVEGSHFGRFQAVLDEYVAMQAADPSFVPAPGDRGGRARGGGSCADRTAHHRPHDGCCLGSVQRHQRPDPADGLPLLRVRPRVRRATRDPGRCRRGTDVRRHQTTGAAACNDQPAVRRGVR